MFLVKLATVRWSEGACLRTGRQMPRLCGCLGEKENGDGGGEGGKAVGASKIGVGRIV